MKKFLEGLIGGGNVHGLRWWLRQLWGEEVANAMERARVLVPDEISVSYPCPGGGDECPREVIYTGDPEFPYSAIPPNAFCCEPVRLKEEHVQTWKLSKTNWDSFLRRLIGIKRGAPSTELFPGARFLGTLNWRGRHVEVLLVPESTHSLAATLKLRQVLNRPTLALIPARGWHPCHELESYFCAGNPVEVVYLEDVLSLREGEVVYRAPTPLDEVESPYCILMDADGAGDR